MTEDTGQLLDHAIEQAMAQVDTRPGITSYVTVAVTEVMGEDNTLISTYEVFVGTQALALHNALGLVEYAKQFLLGRLEGQEQ